MSYYYSEDQNVQMIIALLKSHGIKKMVISPGATNICLIASAQHDGNFEMYSCIDERSAAYMAVGLAAESGEPVVITCTESTASRNYLPGITEANHRKLPILAITGMHGYERIGNLEPQVINRMVSPMDTFRLKVHLPVIKNEKDAEYNSFLINKAILELTRNGGGPVHINLPLSDGSLVFTEKELPKVKMLKRYTYFDNLPEIPQGKVAIYCGSHMPWKEELVDKVETFCAEYDAVVFGSALSGYQGKYRVPAALLSISKYREKVFDDIRLLINFGEEPDDYSTRSSLAECVKEVWRISPDGELRDMIGRLTNLFEMPEEAFFDKYLSNSSEKKESNLIHCKEFYEAAKKEIPDNLPLSNVFVASKIEEKLPEGSCLHLGVSNTLRAWTLYEPPASVAVSANLGCRGIDGCLSSLIGASQVNKDKLYFGVVGDLTFFYDMNSLGNRHIGSNVRLILINNGGGNIFRRASYCKEQIGLEELNKYIGVEGHFANKSEKLVRDYAQDLGFKYLTASDKETFDETYMEFLNPKMTDKPILFEIFTDDFSEDIAFEAMVGNQAGGLKSKVKSLVGAKNVQNIKKLLGK